MPHRDSLWDMVSLWAKSNWGWFAAWAGTMTLAQWQTIIGICSGVLMIGYTLAKTYFLFRNKGKGGDE